MPGQRQNDQKKAGRTTLLNEETSTKFLETIRSGGTIKQACQIVGVCPATIHNWTARGKEAQLLKNQLKEQKKLKDFPKKEQVFLDFFESVEKAKAEGCIARNNTIAKWGENRDWRASAWINKLTDPATYGDQALIDRGVEDKFNELMTNLYWFISPAAYQEVKDAIAVMTKNNIQIGKMTEFQALQILLESDYLPKDAVPKIGIAYINMKQAIKEAFSEDG